MPLELSKTLLQVLRCPESKQSLRLADNDVLEKLNRSIDAGELKNLGGTPLEARLEAGLLREDGRRLYPVTEGFPIMLIDEAVELGGD